MSAVGSVVASNSTITSGSTFSIRPGSGMEWVLHNIAVASSSGFTVQVYDGTTTILVVKEPADIWLSNTQWHVTNTNYLQIYNPTGTIALHFDGVRTT